MLSRIRYRSAAQGWRFSANAWPILQPALAASAGLAVLPGELAVRSQASVLRPAPLSTGMNQVQVLAALEETAGKTSETG